MTWTFSERFGKIRLTCSIEDGAVTGLHFGEGYASPDPDGRTRELWRRVRGELEEYFAGARRSFDLPLRTAGTPFQRAVWEALLAIPYGQTRTYGELARALGRPGAARAVGGACHVNPICILIPCHRVVGAGGALTGFAGGLEIKKALLELERVDREDHHGKSAFKQDGRL